MTRPKRWSEGVPTNAELVTNLLTKGLFTPYNEGKKALKRTSSLLAKEKERENIE